MQYAGIAKQERSLIPITIFVMVLHLVVFFLSDNYTDKLSTPKAKERLVVTTIPLNEKKELPKKQAEPFQESVIPIEMPPLQSIPAPEPAIEQVIAVTEPPPVPLPKLELMPLPLPEPEPLQQTLVEEPIPQPSEEKKIEEPKPEPKPSAPLEEKTLEKAKPEPKPKAPPPKEKKPEIAKTQPKPQPKPKPKPESVKTKEPPTPVKKVEKAEKKPVLTRAPEKKPLPAVKPEKPKPTVKNEVKKESLAKAPVKKEAPKKSLEKKIEAPPPPKIDPEVVAAQEAAKAKRQALLNSAQKSIAKIERTHDKLGASQEITQVAPAIPRPIESLQIETLSIEKSQNLTPQQIGYHEELASRLKLLLRLPDYGEVKIKLTIERTGCFVKVAIVSAESASNRKYIEKTLPTLKYPSFGSHFGSVEQCTFAIALSNDY